VARLYHERKIPVKVGLALLLEFSKHEILSYVILRRADVLKAVSMTKNLVLGMERIAAMENEILS
jgi:hypothetical protein